MIYHGKDLRKGRVSIDGQIYLVTSVTLNRRPIFQDFSLGRILVNTMRQYTEAWQKGFHDRAVRQDEDIRAIARYRVMNPVRAGIVERIWDYPLWDAVWVD